MRNLTLNGRELTWCTSDFSKMGVQSDSLVGLQETKQLRCQVGVGGVAEFAISTPEAAMPLNPRCECRLACPQ